MKSEEIKKIRSAINQQLQINQAISVVDIFAKVGIIEKEHYEKWRKGQIPYLEKICKGNLTKINSTINEIFKYAKELNLKSSWTYFKKYGKGKIKLRFSKSGNEIIENRYATVFLKGGQNEKTN